MKMSLEQFYVMNGCTFAMSGDSLDKCRFPHGRTLRQQRRDEKRVLAVNKEYSERRKEVRKLYEKYVADGKILLYSKEEKMIIKANVHPDNPSVQATRRICEKRGIDWRKNMKKYKLRVYKVSGKDKGKSDHEEFFQEKEEMDERYLYFLSYRIGFDPLPTAWKMADGEWKRLEEY